jgi:hypothetical protein
LEATVAVVVVVVVVEPLTVLSDVSVGVDVVGLDLEDDLVMTDVDEVRWLAVGGLRIEADVDEDGGFTNSDRNRKEVTASGRASWPRPPSIPLMVAGTLFQYFSASVYHAGDSVAYKLRKTCCKETRPSSFLTLSPPPTHPSPARDTQL